MKVLIIFETIEGQTGKIVDFVQTQVVAAGHVVERVNTSDRSAVVSYEGVDKIILAAPVHERRHPKAFEVFVLADRDRLKTHKTLMLSVSLKAAFESGIEEAAEFLTDMEMRTGFVATQSALVAGAVRQSSYDYFSTQILRHVVLRGQDAKFAQGDHEFTDWDALQADIAAFLDL
ncbi:MAG: flavodoxin domain-containing protein [Sulfitobacter sp.]